MHLQNKHDITLIEYKKKFPKAKLRTAFPCKNCGEMVENATSSRQIYCDGCGKAIKQLKILHNVRKYHSKMKRFMQNIYTEANHQHGIQIDENARYGDRIRIDANHSAWDTNIKGQTVLGTVTDSDLKVTKNGRIKGAEKLRKEIARGKTQAKNRRRYG